MKMIVLLEVEVSKTMAETLQRAGFVVEPDGSHFQVKVPNAPAVSQRKTKLAYVPNPTRSLTEILELIASKPAPPLPAPEESAAK